jgi:hypothetical protein
MFCRELLKICFCQRLRLNFVWMVCVDILGVYNVPIMEVFWQVHLVPEVFFGQN